MRNFVQPGNTLTWTNGTGAAVAAGAFDVGTAKPASGDVSGAAVAWAAAGNGVTSLPVKINVGVGTVA